MEKLRGKWLVACSGGPDSMALVDMCLKQNIDVALAHVNYHHRTQADIEEDYIRQYAKEHHLDCYVKNDPFVYDGNFEAKARDYRYAFFVELVKKYELRGVLVGHHQDDVLETFMMQEEKNIIPDYYGLKQDMMYQGILVKRPLLDMTKQELLDYCHAHQITYFTDATNMDTSLRRNHMRHDVIAHMSLFERQMVLQEIKEKNAVLQERVCRVKTYIRDHKIPFVTYRKLAGEDRYATLRILIDEKKKSHVSLKFLQEIDHILMRKNDFMIAVNDGYIVSDHTYFFMHEPFESYEDIFYDLESLQEHTSPYYRIAQGSLGVHAVSLHADDFPIVIRNAQKDDTITMRFGKKKVNRFFIDRKIPKYKRMVWPVIVNCKGTVIFVAGLGCDVAHFTIKPDINVIEY